MTRSDTLDRLKAKLDKLSDEQIAAIADMAEACVRDAPPEDEATRAAIAEGIAEAKAGLRVSQSEMDMLLKQPWR